MSGNEKIFTKGMYVNKRDNAPDFVLCDLSINVEEFIAFLREHASDDKVRIQCAVGRSGKAYAAIDSWKPKQADVNRQGMEQARAAASGGTPGQRKGPDPAQAPAAGFDDTDIPFSNYELKTWA